MSWSWSLFFVFVIATISPVYSNGLRIHESKDIAPWPQDFTHTEVLSSSYNITWQVNFSAKKILFEIHAKTAGTVGFGLRPLADGSNWFDLVRGGLDATQTPYFSDRYTYSISANRVYSRVDENQGDWTYTSITEIGGVTSLKIVRDFVSSDTAQDINITNSLFQMLWEIHYYSDDMENTSVSPNYITASLLVPKLLVNFERFEQLDNLVSVTWSANFTLEKVTFEVRAKATGWVGFGISKNATLVGADLVIGGSEWWTPYFDDRFADDEGIPKIDEQQDWLLLEASEENDFTILKFNRKLYTGDQSDLNIEYENTHFIWALGETDQIDSFELLGSFAVNILDSLVDPTKN